MSKTKEELQRALTAAKAALDEANRRIGELEGRASAPAPSDDPRVDLLLEAVRRSCEDHCPQAGTEGACRNCAIAELVAKAGFGKEERKQGEQENG